ncbi:hypothetical protein PoB_004001700 [Plakobranchus ocellatus]|uniref:Uncharacterized protein n=1 Tax=Plakobranchus ocellatus TaxID=259542 RepID=A0AAV4B2S0_9GAST|nr:hypothetical protein PoB_004001700 [Plakobranchus ocellatus]
MLKAVSNKQIRFGVFNETVFFCGKQGLVLKGDKDDGVLGNNNHSNLKKLLKLQTEFLDDVLAQHLATCKPNATFVLNTLGEKNKGHDIVKCEEGQALIVDS